MSNSQFFQVSLRVRKLLKFEDTLAWNVIQNKLTNICTLDQKDLARVHSKDRKRAQAIENMESQTFIYDSIETDPRTQSLYVKLCRPLIKQSFIGYHVTVLCYGQTTSGKTYTTLGDPNNPGIIPCTLKDIFSQKNNKDMHIWIQYLQIYNEVVDDLLCPSSKPNIIDDPKWGTTVASADKIRVNTFEESIMLMNQGEENRIYRETKIHEHSSRSHTVFKIYIQVNGDKEITYACINLIDLAGSERLSDADQGCQNETGYINKSLFSLTNVITKLAEKQKHIPFRDSKLTRLLTDSLGGNAKTLLICCISPAKNNYFQTLSTIKFANQAKLIKNCPQQQILMEVKDPRDLEIQRLNIELSAQHQIINDLQYENQQLKEQIRYQHTTKSPIHNISSIIAQNNSISSKNSKQSAQQNQNKSCSIAVSSFQTQLVDKQIWVWGSNQDGRLGIGTTQSIARSPVSMGLSFASISCGSHHTVGITSDGSLFAWGRGQRGQLGLGLNTNAEQPEQVQIEDRVLQAACGWQHTIALDCAGRILSWGYGDDGQLGLGDLQSYNNPQVLEGYEGVQIWAGHSHSAFITNQDDFYCFGSNWDGRCMIDTLAALPSPQLVFRDRVRSVSLGVSHMGVILDTGQLIMSGIGSDGQLGTILDESLPQTFRIERNNQEQQLASTGVMVEKFSGGGCTQVACGDQYTLVLTDNGRVFSFGKASYGRLGFKSENDIYEPTAVMGLTTVKRIEAGFRHSGVIDVNGDLYMWGFNFHNQLGLGPNDQDQDVPIKQNLNKVEQLCLGYFHTVALLQ